MPYIPGDHLVICDRCGFKRFASDCIVDWQGYLVCKDTCYEPKHPQHSPPKPLGEQQRGNVIRKENTLAFVPDTDGATLDAPTPSSTPNDGYFITTPVTPDDL